MLLDWENISVKGPLIVISPQGGTPEKVYILRDSGSSLHGEYFVGYGRVDEGWTWITGEYKRGPGWKTGGRDAHGFGTLDSALEAALRTWFEPDYEGGDPLAKWGRTYWARVKPYRR
tara:strand:+ start:246 stop:596 length:351 start_codon:yes stop_codon:yes gene_type:complete